MSTIRTNNHWRPFIYRSEVPADVLANQFDYLDSDTEDGFIYYLGTWYHLCDFMRGGEPGWDASLSESAWSGVLIKLSSDGESYKIARFY